MKATGSADPKVGKDHDDPNKDSQGQDENQVEEEDLAIVATLQEDQEEEVHDSQSEMRASFRSEGVEQPPCNPNQPTDIRPVRGQMRLSNQQMRGWQDSQQEFQVYLQSKEKEVEATRAGMEEKYGKGFWEMDNEGKWVHDYQGPGGAIRIRETSRYLGLLRVERNLMEARNTLKIQEERDITIQALEGDAGTGSISGANAGSGESATGAAGEPEDDPEDPVGEALIKRKYDILEMIGEVRDEGLKLTDDTEKEEQEATMHALVGVTKTLEVQIKSHLKKIKLETKTLKRRLKKKKKEKKEKRKRSEAEEAEEGAGAIVATIQARLESEELKRLVEAEESEEGKDAAAAKYLTKVTGYSMENCAELIRMEKVPGVSTIQAYHRAVNELNQAQQEYYRTLEPGAAAGTATYSGSGTGAGSGSGKPVYSAEFAAEMEAGPERPEDERETRRNKREVQRAQALKADEVKKEKKKKEAESKAGPSRDPRNAQAEKEEMALASMCTLTGRSEEQCAQALAIQSEPGREFLEVYHRACHMLLEDGDPSKEGYANLVKGFQG